MSKQDVERRHSEERRLGADRRVDELPLHWLCSDKGCVERRMGWDRRCSSDRRHQAVHIVALRPQVSRPGWTEAICSCGQRAATCYDITQLKELSNWHALDVGEEVVLFDCRVA